MLVYQTLDTAILARDLERIERWLRARGYYEAKVRAARAVHLDAHTVRVEIEVVQGAPVLVRRVELRGLAELPLDVTGPALSAIEIREGDHFEEERFDADKRGLVRALTNHGFAFAEVEAKAHVNIAAHAADVTYQVTPGPRARFGPIKIVGLREIPPGPALDTFGVHEHDPYSSDEIEDGQKALAGLGVFGRIEIKQDRSHPELGIVPVTIEVKEAKLRTLRLGVGGRFDVLRLSGHVRGGWEDRNFLGGMRRLAIERRAERHLLSDAHSHGRRQVPRAHAPLAGRRPPHRASPAVAD